MRLIKNGSKFPQPVKRAALDEVFNIPAKRRVAIAAERNVSIRTLNGWVRDDISRQYSNNMHPNAAAGLRNHWAKYHADKAYNTPTVRIEKGQTVIDYQGKTYH